MRQPEHLCMYQNLRKTPAEFIEHRRFHTLDLKSSANRPKSLETIRMENKWPIWVQLYSGFYNHTMYMYIRSLSIVPSSSWNFLQVRLPILSHTRFPTYIIPNPFAVYSPVLFRNPNIGFPIFIIPSFVERIQDQMVWTVRPAHNDAST